MCRKGRKDVLVFPCGEGKLRHAETLCFDSDFYKVSGAQLGVKIGNCLVSLLGRRRGWANFSRQVVGWISTRGDADLGHSAASRKEGECSEAAGGETGAKKVSR